MAAAKAGGTVKTVKATPARGGFGIGLIVGLLVGLAVALAVALYITKAPIPFVNKVPQRTAEQDAAEAERNKNWDPNAPLGGRSPTPRAAAQPASAPAGDAPALPTVTTTTAPPPASSPPVARASTSASASAAAPARSAAAASTPTRDPAAILAGQAGAGAAPAAAPATKPPIFFVQAGAYSSPDDAEAQRARLAMSGFTAKVMARDQSGKTVYRVRLGPFDERDQADDARDKLGAAGVESTLVRVER